MRKNHNRLYYGAYRHKNEFRLPGSLMFYPTTNENLLNIKKRYPDAPEMNYLADFILQNRNNCKFRFQGRKAIFYTNKKLAQKLVTKFWEFWTGTDIVDPRFKDIDANTVGCTRLPHGKYHYQIHMKKDAQHFISDTQRRALWQFLERNVDNCLVTNMGLIDYLETKIDYCYGGYFYVTEEKYLTPIYMLAQQAIEKVIKFRKVENGSNKKTTR